MSNPLAGRERTKSFREMKRAVAQVLHANDGELPDFIAVDPASTSLGFAVYKDGICIQSGVLKAAASRKNYERLLRMYDKLLDHNGQDLLVVEQIRGNAHKVLHWAVGTTITAIRPSYLIECPYEVWRCLMPDGYEKSDEGDAILMGQAVLETYNLLKEEE